MLTKAIIRELGEIVGPQHVLTSPEDLVAYSYDGTFVEHCPDAVVSPVTTDEVSRVMQVAFREEIPLVPRGMASGLAAASVPASGGLVLCLTRMNKVLNIDMLNMTAQVEAGVVTADLQAQAESMGLFYPPDPSSIKHSVVSL